MKKVGFGIIGIGRQGLRLAEHVRKDIEPGNLVAVCRRSDNGHEYSSKHGIKFYSNHLDLLDDDDVSAVIITTPSGLHGKQALEALEAKKHVLIDKPIASTVEEGLQIEALAKKNKRIVGINFPLRVNPISRAMKQSMDRIGTLRKVQVLVSHGPPRSTWQSDFRLSKGGVIMDLGSHYFDLISYLTGKRPKAVTSAYSEQDENEHSGFIELSYEGFSASVVMLRNQKFKKNILTCAGDKGLLFADYAARVVVTSNNHEIHEMDFPASNDFEEILNNMVRTINKKEDIIAGAEAGINSLKTTLSAYKTIKTKKETRL